MHEIIFDNCVLSNFALSNSIETLKKMYSGTACITDFVAAENMKGIVQGHEGLTGIRQALIEGWLKEITLKGRVEKRLFDSLSVSMGLGEASSMAVARTRNYVFACDDKAARREAGLLGIRLTGTVGILVKAVRGKIMNVRKADELLKAMMRNGFYSPVVSVREVLQGK